MPSRLPLLFALLLCSCGSDVRNVPLSDIDLSDMNAVRQIGRSLSPPERSALITYAATHNSASSRDCGHGPVGHGAVVPKTIGQAIAITLAQAAIGRSVPAGYESPSVRTQVGEQQDDLILRRDVIVDRESTLLADHGAAAKKLAEWQALESKRANYTMRLAALRSRKISPS